MGCGKKTGASGSRMSVSLRANDTMFTVPGASAPVCSCLLSIGTFLMEQLLASIAGELLILGIGGSRIKSLLAGFAVEGV